MNGEKIPTKEPDLRNLVVQLKNEVSSISGLSYSIKEKLGQIDKGNKPESECKRDVESPSCFIDEINLVIASLRVLKAEMEETEMRMISLVG